jgi:hypothetical protein
MGIELMDEQLMSTEADPLIIEVWRPVVDYPNNRVSSFGRIMRIDKKNIWRIVYPYLHHSGYSGITFRLGDKKRSTFVHIVVAETFLGSRPPGLECCHADDVKANNMLANLRWDTHKANLADSLKNGKRAMGESASCRKLGSHQVDEVRRMSNNGMSPSEIATVIGITCSNVQAILTGKIWSHYDSGFPVNYKPRRSPTPPLSDVAQDEVRELFVNGMNFTDISKRFSVCPRMITKIIRNTKGRRVPYSRPEILIPYQRGGEKRRS